AAFGYAANGLNFELTRVFPTLLSHGLPFCPTCGCGLSRCPRNPSQPIVLGGSAATHPQRALDADVCAVVREDIMQRARIDIDGASIDLFVGGRERLERDFKSGGVHQHLVRLFATGKHLYGDKSATDALQRQARVALRSPAPAPSKQSVFEHRSRPFNLLHKFKTVCGDDPATAGLIVAELVHSCVEAYFALNRIWTIGVRERIAVIAMHNPNGAVALRQVTQTPLSALRENPQPLDEMVALLVGEQSNEETWIKGAV
ncbi:MAG TPA: hypothetical protein VFN37_08355, partial [Candidatus Baltobacteraceae bacterium]|nr:hypothetical protein [Candidatus Baltobacteraceae bacterium]